MTAHQRLREAASAASAQVRETLGLYAWLKPHLPLLFSLAVLVLNLVLMGMIIHGKCPGCSFGDILR